MRVPYFKPWITHQDKKSVATALDQYWLTNGPTLKKFEEKIKAFIGSKYCLGVGSGTHALHLAIRSLEIGKNDEVIVPTFTFAATANAVRYCGAEPILVDVESDTFNISVEAIRKKITKRTKAIIVVHYGGQSCDMGEITSIAKKHGLFIIEDCAHSLGSVYKSKKCGNLGDIGCFSFYPTKVITTGEGGMISTNTLQLYKKIKLLRSHGMTVQAAERETAAQWKYDIVDVGYNYRLDEIRASLGLSQANRIEKINKMRIKIAHKYNQLISKIRGLTIPTTRSNRNHIFHLYTIKVENDFYLTRDELFQKLHEKGIGTSVQYYPLHLMSYNRSKYGTKSGEFPNANKLKDQILCLPIYPTMTTKEIEYVVSNLK